MCPQSQVWKGYLQRKRFEQDRRAEMEFIGMVSPPWLTQGSSFPISVLCTLSQGPLWQSGRPWGRTKHKNREFPGLFNPPRFYSIPQDLNCGDRDRKRMAQSILDLASLPLLRGKAAGVGPAGASRGALQASSSLREPLGAMLG